MVLIVKIYPNCKRRVWGYDSPVADLPWPWPSYGPLVLILQPHFRHFEPIKGYRTLTYPSNPSGLTMAAGGTCPYGPRPICKLKADNKHTEW